MECANFSFSRDRKLSAKQREKGLGMVEQHVLRKTMRAREALLDQWRLDAWLAFFTADARYVVPTTDLPERDPKKELVFIDDDMVRFRARVESLKSRHGHREYPWSRTRHFVTNVRIKLAARVWRRRAPMCGVL
jgi:3-phenylpropionate/cinnamic acid dioxygenase small subunit